MTNRAIFCQSICSPMLNFEEEKWNFSLFTDESNKSVSHIGARFDTQFKALPFCWDANTIYSGRKAV